MDKFVNPQHASSESVDRVLTFRNIHNWYIRGCGDERVLATFKAFYHALKSGGILGVVEHRLPASRPLPDQEASGYMKIDYVASIALEAGFHLVDSSEINGNPKDNANHPKGVWTLPTSLRLGDQDRHIYEGIG